MSLSQSPEGIRDPAAEGEKTMGTDVLDLAPPKGPVSTKGTDALRELREDRA